MIAPLGKLLLKQGDITPEQLDQALQIQQGQPAALGAILLSLKALNPLTLYRALAAQWQLPHVNLITSPPDPSLCHFEEWADYLAWGYLPWRKEEGGLILACHHPSDTFMAWANDHYTGQAIRCVVTSPRDLRHALLQQFGEQLDEHTRTLLLRTMPRFSAFATLWPEQYRGLWVLIGLLSLAAIFAPYDSLVLALVGLNGFYFGSIGLKFALLAIHRSQVHNHHQQARALDNATLPVYSILVPMYRERESVPRLLAALRALDYPKTKLDVKLVVEADDTETIAAIKHAQPEEWCEMIAVPPSQPRTKPKACNVALSFVRGEFVTIYDAEDQPHPLQLKQAVAAFAAAPADVACFQARLNYYNATENLLTRLFAIEYAALFDIQLPGLQAMGVPIPLGGTSNHLRTATLREVGSWDPFNVTEDADLGMRLAMMGYRTRVLNAITLEEAPITLGAWIKQRSRWIKGYMQTWLVYMRAPVALFRQLGGAGFWGFQFFVGAPCFVFLLSPVLWALCAAWLMGALPLPDLPRWLWMMCMVSLGLGIACHLLFAAIASHRWRWGGMGVAVAAFPFYWLLHSIASVRALWQLIHRPHYWEKTSHGITRQNLQQTVDKPEHPR